MANVVTDLTVDEARALTIKEPWVSAILHNGKNVENRSRSTNYRGLMVIHSSTKVDRLALRTLSPWKERVAREGVAAVEAGLITGAVVGVVKVLDCVRNHQSPWAEPGFWHWVLANPRSLREPLVYRGQQSLFPLPREVRERILAMLDQPCS